MKKFNLVFLLQICGALALTGTPMLAGAETSPASAAPAPVPAPAPALPSGDEAGYLIGLNFGQQMHQVGITSEVPTSAVERGLKDGLAGKKIAAADQQRLQAFIHSVLDASLARNREAAKKFLAHNAKAKGVKTTASGLQYKVIDAGSAKEPAPTPADEVTVQYRGRLLDGTEFDSSYARGTPATFPVDRVIKGWQDALVLMKPGAKWELFIPPELAYGSTPRPGIPPGSLLIFDVDLLSVKPGAASTPPPVPTESAPVKQ